ncbi:hypothetical protein C462_08190 [Halorubrum distributum JCM 13916]|uniref:Uncharacterized protein n=1 Tax=Halorubrum distributum JCM 13916 TaxID=1230455 RepID=M0PNJ8_9EURY|nr:hypothetical protein [Halorubrum arcis]EMA71084.1 hypothetical protein C462_08190 [Halorubrum arcis JCM 13916]
MEAECVFDKTPARLEVVPLTGCLSTIAFVCGVVYPTKARTELIGRFNVVFRLPRSDLLVDVFEARGELVGRVPLVQFAHLDEILTDRVRLVRRLLTARLRSECPVVDQSCEVFRRRLVGNLGFFGDPIGCSGITDREGDRFDALGRRQTVGPALGPVRRS